jgi:hypothetical protein
MDLTMVALEQEGEKRSIRTGPVDLRVVKSIQLDSPRKNDFICQAQTKSVVIAMLRLALYGTLIAI